VNEDITTAMKVLAVLGGTTALVWIGIVMVKAAKRGGGGRQGVIAAPPVAEAQDSRIRSTAHSGGPLD